MFLEGKRKKKIKGSFDMILDEGKRRQRVEKCMDQYMGGEYQS